MDGESGTNGARRGDDAPGRDERPIPPERRIVFEPWDYDLMREGACTYASPEPEQERTDDPSDDSDRVTAHQVSELRTGRRRCAAPVQL